MVANGRLSASASRNAVNIVNTGHQPNRAATPRTNLDTNIHSPRNNSVLRRNSNQLLEQRSENQIRPSNVGVRELPIRNSVISTQPVQTDRRLRMACQLTSSWIIMPIINK